MNFFTKLITNNTGVSSKSFFLVLVGVIGCLLLLAPFFVLIYEVVMTNTISTDLVGMAAYIGAVSTALGIAGYTKVASEKNEKPYIEEGVPNIEEKEITEEELG